MTFRTTQMEQLTHTVFDTLIVGGGINGAVSAAALSAKGGSVALIDKNDFASATSQESSNLIWGGIKYLENMEFGLVRNLCLSRNRLMQAYPSSIQEIRFLVTIEKGFRHWPISLYAGGLLYWMLGNFFTKKPIYATKHRLRRMESILKTENAMGGFEYSDAYLPDSDARFVFRFIRRAVENGTTAINYLESIGSLYLSGLWHTKVRDTLNGKIFTIRSRTLINACGPWADELNRNNGQETKHCHIFSKGIHLIVNRITENKKVLSFFADDGRLFFAIPMGNRTCIGTTDTPVTELPATITEEDRKFVLENINKRLKLSNPLTKKDIIAERCGVRPLVSKKNKDSRKSDWMTLSRKHEIEYNLDEKYISIFGGKLSDCLNIGEEITEIVSSMEISLSPGKTVWYGEPPAQRRLEFFEQVESLIPSISPQIMGMKSSADTIKMCMQFWRRYGEDAFLLLEMIRKEPTLLEEICEDSGFVIAESQFAKEHEIICQLDDFLRRRTHIAQTVPVETLKHSEGLKKACKIFFGNQADRQFEKYFKEKNL